jgi:hypothetical protein
VSWGPCNALIVFSPAITVKGGLGATTAGTARDLEFHSSHFYGALGVVPPRELDPELGITAAPGALPMPGAAVYSSSFFPLALW